MAVAKQTLLSNLKGFSPSRFSWSAAEWANTFGKNVKIPHEGQVYVCDHPAKEKVIAWGRRGGKSSCMGEIYLPRWCLTPGHEDTQVNVFALFQGQAEITMNYMLGCILNAPLEAFVEHISYDIPPTIIWKNGVRVYFKNLAKGGKHARGEGSDLTLIDERAFIPDQVIEAAVAPMQAASKFAEWVEISTPNGKNQFYLNWLHGQPDRPNKPDLNSFHMPTWDNPAISREYLRRTRARSTTLTWRIEYGAEFVDDQNAQFPWKVIQPCINDELQNPTGPIPGHKYVGGWDPADRIDRSAVIVIDTSVTPRRVVLVKNIAGIGYVRQEDEITKISHRYFDAPFFMDSTKHDSTMEHLAVSGVNIEGQHWTNEYKREMMDLLRWDMEQRNIEFPYQEDLKNDLVFYRREKTPTGLIHLGAAEHSHDDYVSALGLANLLANVGNSEIEFDWSE